MKTAFLLIVIFFLNVNGFSQRQDSTYKFILGFNFGLNYTNLQANDVAALVKISNSSGFRVGVLSDLKVTKHLAFSPRIELSYNNSKISVAEIPKNHEVLNIYPVLMDFCTPITYTLYNKRLFPYISFGPSYRVPLINNKKMNYATTKSGIAVDLGFGIEKQFSYFKLAPEIRYSYGLTNISEGKSINQLYFHTFTLVFNFKD